jgi:hypothetical protein
LNRPPTRHGVHFKNGHLNFSERQETRMPTLYETLCAIAESFPDRLVAYSDDLHKIDRSILEESEAGQEFVWLLRRHGTELFPLRRARDPESVTFWLQDGVLAYHLRVSSAAGASGTAKPVTHAQASALAALPPPRGASFWAPAGFALCLRRDGIELGRVSNMSGQGWDAVLGPSSLTGALGRFESSSEACAAVERAVASERAA